MIKKIFAVMVLALLGLSILQVMMEPIVAQERVFARAYDVVNVRSGPSTAHPVVGQLAVNDIVDVTGRSDNENNWLEIEFAGQMGWVAYFTVTVEGDTSVLPIRQSLSTPVGSPIESPVFPSDSDTGDAFVTLIRRVNVRSGPGTDYARVGTLRPGDTAPILGRTTDNQWLQIEFQGRTGWVSYFVVGISGALEDIAFIEPSELVEPSPTPPPTSVPSTPTPRVITLLTRYNSNLRAAPSFSAEILEVVPFSTELPIEARTENGNWLRVTYNGENGWLAAVLVSALRRRDLEIIPVER